MLGLCFSYVRRTAKSFAERYDLFSQNQTANNAGNLTGIGNPYSGKRQLIYWEQVLDKNMQRNFCRTLRMDGCGETLSGQGQALLNFSSEFAAFEGARTVFASAPATFANEPTDFKGAPAAFASEPAILSIIYKALLLLSPAGLDMGQVKLYCMEKAGCQKSSGAIPEFLYGDAIPVKTAAEPAAAAAFVVAVSSYINYSGECDFLLKKPANKSEDIYDCCIRALNHCRDNTNAYGLISAARGGFFDYMLGADSYADIFATIYYIAALRLFLPFFKQPENVRAAAKTITLLCGNIKQKLGYAKSEPINVSTRGGALSSICMFFCERICSGNTPSTSGGERLFKENIKYLTGSGGSSAAVLCLALALSLNIDDNLIGVINCLEGEGLNICKSAVPLYKALVIKAQSGLGFKLGKIYIKEHSCRGNMRFSYGTCDVSVVKGDRLSVTVDGVRLGVGRYFTLGKNAHTAEIILPS